MLKKTVNLMPFRPAKIRGAGDVVHALAQPIARAVDAVAGTNLTNCGGCAQRRETLNQIIPMKKILSILSIISVVLTASAQRDWTLSTNNYWADTFVTNVFVGNTSTDPGRDTSLMAWQKINCDFNLIASWHALEAGALAYLDANAVTNTGTGYTLTGTWYGDGTALLINGTNLVAGTVNSNSLDADTLAWIASLEVVPGGAGGASLTDVTNIATDITVVSSNGVVGWVNSQNFVTALTTNIARTSHRYTIFATNNFTMSGSNYVGRFSQVYDWQLTEPQIGSGGVSPSTSLPEALWGSFSGTNNWFPLTNGAVFFTNISISVVGTNITGLGGVTIYGLDHPELYGNVVAFDGQSFSFNGSKIATLNDLAATVHVLAPPVQMAGGWILDSQIVSGNELVTFYSHNSKVFEMAAGGSSINQAFGGLDGTGTNITIMTPATNLLTGWTLEQCTNLSAPVLWLPTSNFTTNISGGGVTFTVPMNRALNAQFFRLRLPAAGTATFSVPATFSAGALYPSNSWSLYAITNVMHAGDIMTVNSNGVKLVDVWMSNSTPILKPHW